LQPGPQAVEVRAERTIDRVQGGQGRGDRVTAAHPHYSIWAVFMLVSEISSTSPASGTTGDVLTVNGVRLYHEDYRCFVLVGDVMIEIREPEAGDPWNPPTDTTVEVPLSALSLLDTGENYPVRVMVNGAQSRGLDHLFQLT
jgi:hypothetical protein